MGKFSRLGNDLYNGKRSINFVGRAFLWYSISAIIILLAVGGLYFKGLNMGIEFVGGSQYKVTLDSSQVNQQTADELRTAVAGTGIPDASAPVVTTAGTAAILVETETLTESENAQVLDAITRVTGATEISQTEIGASWGRDVANRSLTGLCVFLVLVVLFIWAYFRQWKMSVAAIVALAHDLLITVGVYALSGFEVSPATVTGLLTILGFSLYDTVVVFDKIRENTKNLKDKRTTYAAAANLAVNQTLVRSINTSIVALIPVGAILYVGAVQLGSGSMKDLALALFVGMAAGAYSSIFIATPILVQLKSGEKEIIDAEKRAKARLQKADRYASVPVFTEDLPLRAEPEDDADPGDGTEDTPVARPPRAPEAMQRGRVVPPARGPVQQSNAAGRAQPTRQTRSKRGKK
ncbi:protein translocase subunit SecF [Nocardioides sp.]|jgi:preprotein translocase subunit SecF|uniref:protein translocase subunit SecF n=1 Tax=Nocardioides sp. TaxID=35761 RepID=UPI0031FE7BB5|nr:protein translocase subunit secF [Nocardioides sp.]